tara:strand:- start:2188 stop:3135 length:948 start_codon:yes stop_codon:yes gene_type:complete
MNRKAIIFGIKGYKLTIKEKKLLKNSKPWGIILFSRNIRDFRQLKFLINSIKMLFNDKKYPILIDQEGGAVSRLNNIINLSFFSQYFFGQLHKKNRKLFNIVYKIYIDKISSIFKNVGININTAPVLDVVRKKKSDFIGTRSFSENPMIVSKLGNLTIKLFKKNKISTVVKHIPGHGNTKQDSHFNTPIIKSSKKELITKDFRPFKMCKSHFAMTAHAIYPVYDSKKVATHSKIIIDKIIRNHINFKGLIISDDISMKSLSYNLEVNATKALQAGCNLILHCNGNIREMHKLAKVIPRINSFTEKKTSHFYKFLG